MGTGAQTWQFNKDICNQNSLDPFNAVMTVCKRDEFTCDGDGGCISMEERCDQFPNCEDFSDEANCQLVVLPENYVKDYAPFTVNEDGQLQKVSVLIKVDLISILEIDEVGQKVVNQFNLYNMKTNLNMNTLTTKEKGAVWVPQLVFTNTE